MHQVPQMHLVPPKDQMLKVTFTIDGQPIILEGEARECLPKITEALERAGCDWVDVYHDHLLIPLVNSEIIRICNAFLEMAKRDEKKQPGSNIIPLKLRMEFNQLSANEKTASLSTEEAASS